MRKVLLDCGAHCGCSRRKFLREFKDASEYEIFSFEPDPALNEYCDSLINKAVWIENTTKTFYKFWIDGGSSLSKVRADVLQQTKPNYYNREEIEVECFDLRQFIKENFSKDDLIILKMDIEGAEYDVLPHLIEDGMDYIGALFIEWHAHRLNMDSKVTLDLIEKIKTFNIPIFEWDAMDEKYCPIFSLPERKNFHVWASQ